MLQMALWPRFSEFVDNVSSPVWLHSKQNFDTKVNWEEENLSNLSNGRRFFFDFTNVSLISHTGDTCQFLGKKTPILIKCPKSYFAVWILILVEDGSIKRWKYSNSSHKKAEFYSLQNRESQGPFWRITQQQQRILWCNRGAVVNFWRLFLRIEERTQKNLQKWPEVIFVMPPQNISANGMEFQENMGV